MRKGFIDAEVDEVIRRIERNITANDASLKVIEELLAVGIPKRTVLNELDLIGLINSW